MTADSDGSSLGVQILIIVLLTAFKCIFSAAEIAFVSINQGKMAQKAQEGDKRAIKVMRLLENSDEFLATIQVAITLQDSSRVRLPQQVSLHEFNHY